MSIKKWRLPEDLSEESFALQQELFLPPFICSVLANRGYKNPELANDFLKGFVSLHDPFLMKDMDRAVQRLNYAVEIGEYICVYGDYDCDGITATALLYSYLQDIGARVMYYIPDRDEEGYGLNNMAIDRLHSLGVQLIVTVDNGVAALDEVSYAAELGIELIITDHHQPRELLPNCAAVLDPHRSDCDYPNKNLCGCGVAFKLICAMEGDLLCEEMLEHFAPIVAIATVADVVELSGENRAIVRSGLQTISEYQSVGLQVLLEICGLANKKISSSSVAFSVVPRLNAAGRIGKADLAVELLLTDDYDRALELADEINSYNETRKNLVDEVMLQINNIIDRNPSVIEERIIVIAGKGWHHGVIGIAAAKMVEKYSKPCLLIAVEGEESRGSARSVEGYSMIAAISRCSSFLTRYGGHNQAAGLSLRTQDISAFRKALLDDARELFDIMPVDELKIDAPVQISELNVESVQQLDLLEPFGFGNEAPVFMIEGCRLEAIYPLSEDRHIKLRFSVQNKVFQALYFGMSSRDFPYVIGDLLDLAVSLDINEYSGERSVSVKVRNVRPHAVPQDRLVIGKQYYEKFKRNEPVSQKIRDYVTPTRDDIAVLYRYLKQVKNFPFDYDQLWCRLGGKINYCKLRFCVDIMEELSLLSKVKNQGDFPIIRLQDTSAKVNLEESVILKQLKGDEVYAS